MRKKKKIVQSLVAGILSLGLCASVAPMGALAAYDRYDVNHDGAVNINDVIYLNRYMVGAFSVASPSALDINQNKIIDIADSLEIMARIVGSSTSVEFVDITQNPNSVQTIPDELLAEFSEEGLFPSEEIAELYATSNSNTYYKYNYTTKALSTYTLEVSENAPASISDVDELNSINATSNDNYYKITGNGMDGLVRINTSSGGMSTGFIIGDHVIATAAHCVFRYNSTSTNILDKFHTTINVGMCDADSGTTNSIRYTVKEVHVPKEYVNNPTSDSVYDYALVTVSEDLSEYTHFNLGVPSTNYLNSMDEVPITVSGFLSGGSVVYTSIGQEKSGWVSLENYLYTTNRTNVGMSGGPVYTVTKISQDGNFRERIYTAIGIHTAHWYNKETGEFICSSGPAMNSSLLAFYKINSNIGY
ncbi:MAG: trypsin-like peptidase domain-containing protein [Oscillospiraceae bacterium]|nr:trypsin-like peptidase domain-containing protein [Oscillospiraceae bacterium]